MVFQRQLTETSRKTVIALFIAILSANTAAAEGRVFPSGPWTKQTAGRTVTMDIWPKPLRAMAELTFCLTVTPSGALPDAIPLDLDMPGMMMGKNQVLLKRSGCCTWKGTGIIVRCMSGRKLWQATINCEALNNTAFPFNVN
ncbi:MAG: hypothetical protein FDX30_04315 [Chlorobium sp.]|nr:MAG: hypothetical protein FDX30_04315 [Chlorobium sp.]